MGICALCLINHHQKSPNIVTSSLSSHSTTPAREKTLHSLLDGNTVAVGMSIDLLLSFNVRVFDGQTPDVEVIANRDNNGVLN